MTSCPARFVRGPGRTGRGPGRTGRALLAMVLASLLLPAGSALASRVERETLPDARGADVVERQMILGVSIPFGERIGRLKRFSASLGERTPATWTIWSRWGDKETRAFPSELVARVHALGVTPMIWWAPIDPDDPRKPWFPRHRNTTAGYHDGYIRRFARRARDFGRTVLLRYAPEANGGHHAWTTGHFDNTADTFVDAWRHVWGLFLEEGATNVKFVWSVAKQSCPGGCNPYAAFYPGDGFVDYAAFSSFNWGSHKDGWKTMLQGLERVTRHLESISTRPIVVIESASSPDGGDKAAWIREGYPEVYAALPSIVAVIYLNADLRASGHPDWRLTRPPEVLAAYAEIAGLPEFRGRFKKRSGGTIADALAAGG